MKKRLAALPDDALTNLFPFLSDVDHVQWMFVNKHFCCLLQAYEQVTVKTLDDHFLWFFAHDSQKWIVPSPAGHEAVWGPGFRPVCHLILRNSYQAFCLRRQVNLDFLYAHFVKDRQGVFLRLVLQDYIQDALKSPLTLSVIGEALSRPQLREAAGEICDVAYRLLYNELFVPNPADLPLTAKQPSTRQSRADVTNLLQRLPPPSVLVLADVVPTFLAVLAQLRFERCLVTHRDIQSVYNFMLVVPESVKESITCIGPFLLDYLNQICYMERFPVEMREHIPLLAGEMVHLFHVLGDWVKSFIPAVVQTVSKFEAVLPEYFIPQSAPTRIFAALATGSQAIHAPEDPTLRRAYAAADDIVLNTSMGSVSCYAAVRIGLAKLCNRFPQEAFDYFRPRIGGYLYRCLWGNIVNECSQYTPNLQSYDYHQMPTVPRPRRSSKDVDGVGDSGLTELGPPKAQALIQTWKCPAEQAAFVRALAERSPRYSHLVDVVDSLPQSEIEELTRLFVQRAHLTPNPLQSTVIETVHAVTRLEPDLDPEDQFPLKAPESASEVLGLSSEPEIASPTTSRKRQHEPDTDESPPSRHHSAG